MISGAVAEGCALTARPNDAGGAQEGHMVRFGHVLRA